MAIPPPASHCDAVQLAMWSAESLIYNPYQLEYAWYEPYKLQLDRVFPTRYSRGRNGDSSITVSPQYWLLLPNAPGIFNPHHAGTQILDFLLLYTKFTSSLRNALHSKIPLLNIEVKNKPTFITQQSQFKICRKQALQQASRAYAYPNVGGPRLLYSIVCVGKFWKWLCFTDDPGNGSPIGEDGIRYQLNTQGSYVMFNQIRDDLCSHYNNFSEY